MMKSKKLNPTILKLTLLTFILSVSFPAICPISPTHAQTSTLPRKKETRVIRNSTNKTRTTKNKKPAVIKTKPKKRKHRTSKDRQKKLTSRVVKKTKGIRKPKAATNHSTRAKQQPKKNNPYLKQANTNKGSSSNSTKSKALVNPFKEPSEPSEEPSEPSEGTSGSDGEDSPAKSKKKTSVIHSTVQFIIKNGTMIVIALGIFLAGSLGLLFLNAKKQRDIELEKDTMDQFPIQNRSRGRDLIDDDDDEGPRRVLVDPTTGKSRQSLKRDDSEYALVVDEDELNLPHHDDGSSSGEFERIVLKVQESIEKNDFEEAYNYYQERIQTNKLAAFHAGLERRLGKYYLKMKNFKTAAQILQHHVSTQPATEVEPEIYFDLGYIYFKEKTLEKSRHFFQMFADRNRDPSQNSRALKLIQSLDKVKHLG